MESTTAGNRAATSLNDISRSLVELVQAAGSGVVAVKAAPYRVVSGVIISDDLVAVAHHTLRREEKVPVKARDTPETLATVLGRDPSVDVAILKVEGMRAKPLQFADTSSLAAGCLAAVIGMTVDVGATVSLGILGAVGGPRRTWRGGLLDQFLRLDVNLYPSQAGAAVVDDIGHLMGLATPGLLRHSAVAVPITTVNRVAQELVREGRIRRGYLGVGVQPVAIPENLRSKLGESAETGLMILSVERASAAEDAGLQLGDILMSLGGAPVGDIDELQAALRGDAVGRSVNALIVRGGEVVQKTITIRERARAEA
jgi:S1-C subfamily serine protease